MNLGFFTMPIHPLGKDWRLSLREDREAFLLADKLGFTEAYVGEHVTDQAENITSCIAFIAWIAAATKQIRLGTGTINMPNTHPAIVAASVAMLDHMLDGRLIFGISPGGTQSWFEVTSDNFARFWELMPYEEVWRLVAILRSVPFNWFEIKPSSGGQASVFRAPTKMAAPIHWQKFSQ